MNKYKFLKILENKLKEKNYDKVSEIVEKYKTEIEERYKNHEKQKDIISSFGDIDLLCEKIINQNKKKTKSFKLFKLNNKKIVLKNKKNTKYLIISFILLFIFSIISCITFVSSFFCFLDGVSIIGSIISSFVFLLICLVLLDLINKLLINKEVNLIVYFRILIILFIIFVASILILIIELYKIDYISKVSQKYQATRIVENIKMSTNVTSISFNSNYNTTYSVKYIDELEDNIKIEVKYYDVIYDYDIKKEPGKVYISLNLPYRDVVSFYINNLKERKIYNIDELERYSVTIFVNEKDKDRFIVEKSL